MSEGGDGLAARLASIRARISGAAERSGRRADEVTLLAVSKTQPAAAMAELARVMRQAGGQPIFGESQVQEFKRKRPELDFAYSVHMIGALQRNKARDAVVLFDLIESVHSDELARALDREAARAGKRQDIYLQVNISRDEAKRGFAPDELSSFAAGPLAGLASLRLCGLMTITRLYDDPEGARPDFRAMRELYSRLCAARLEHAAPRLELSMGMSGDYEVAIEEGATVVRIGTALFGERG